MTEQAWAQLGAMDRVVVGRFLWMKDQEAARQEHARQFAIKRQKAATHQPVNEYLIEEGKRTALTVYQRTPGLFYLILYGTDDSFLAVRQPGKQIWVFDWDPASHSKVNGEYARALQTLLPFEIGGPCFKSFTPLPSGLHEGYKNGCDLPVLEYREVDRSKSGHPCKRCPDLLRCMAEGYHLEEAS